METNKLNEILRKHKMWLNDEEGGVCANLSNANLAYANLSNTDLYDANLDHANLAYANLSYAKLSYADLDHANLDSANLYHADLECANLDSANLDGANLYRANLDSANLVNANLDFSCLPLWCGSLSAQFDDKQLKQIAYHLVKAGLQSKNASEETKAELAKLIDFANGFHRVNECGKIKSE